MWKKSNVKILQKCNMKIVRYRKSEKRKEFNTKKYATWNECNTKKVPGKNIAMQKKSSMEIVQYKKCAEVQHEKVQHKKVQHGNNAALTKCYTKRLKHKQMQNQKSATWKMKKVQNEKSIRRHSQILKKVHKNSTLQCTNG